VRVIVWAVALIALLGGATGSTADARIEPLPVGHYSTVEMASVDEVCAGQPRIGLAVDIAAWQEVRSLRDLGLPACDVTWRFGSLVDWSGKAWADATTGQVTILINGDPANYAGDSDPAWAIRSNIRHEFGHALVFMAGWTSGQDHADLRALFPEPLVWSDSGTMPGQEAAADAIATVLAERRGENQERFYVDTPLAASLVNAETIIADAAGEKVPAVIAPNPGLAPPGTIGEPPTSLPAPRVPQDG